MKKWQEILGWIKVKLIKPRMTGKTGADWDSAPEQTGTLLMRQS